MNYRYYYEDCPPGSEMTLAPRTVTAEEIVGFASRFDPVPFHLDEEAGRASLLGGLAASGWHVCSLAMKMICDSYLLDSASLGSPGIRECKWLAPVLAGDTLHGKVVVEGARVSASRPGLGLLELRCELFNQQDKPVLMFRNIGMMATRRTA
ncbi:MAG: MaoC family dehydratase [Nitratireductor sp.]|nr:MaoC family dehydratase [Nitratireductor sp.]